MQNNLKRNRALASHRQSGLCCYCKDPMCIQDPLEFARRYGLSSRQALQRQCTAEHLVAKCDGGTNCAVNISSACHYCNQRRHRCSRPMDSLRFAEIVRRRMQNGRWHSASLLDRMPPPRSAS